MLSADILGKVYEEFLGKTIRLTSGRQAKIESKPEVRKAGGVYYTPAYVVDYLVERTLGKLLEGANPKKVASIRLLDPACGSGSFLIVAYQKLLDWHLSWYEADGPEKHAKGRLPALFKGRRGKWHLTITKRKEILLNSIYGVDLDSQAVEVTKLSLLLKVLEGEVEWLKNLKLFEERALPDLGKNILCGNSLVGFDFLDALSAGSLAAAGEELDEIRTFNWHDRFARVFDDGGFDVVIGNPPYLSYAGRQSVELPPTVRQYFERVYKCSGWPTSHSFFMEKSVQDLARRFVAFIVPDQVGHLDGYRSLREVIGGASRVSEVKYWGEKVFKGVTTPALTFIADRESKKATKIIELSGLESEIEFAPGESWYCSPQKELLERLKAKSFSVRPYVKDCGIRTTSAKTQVVPVESAKKNDLIALEGKRVGRYWCSPPTIAVKNIREVLRSADENYESAEYLIRQTAAYPIVAPHRHAKYFRNSLHALKSPEGPMDVRYLVGLLNSKVVRSCYVAGTRESGQKAFPQVKLGALEKLPLREIDFSNVQERKVHDEIVELVQALLDLQMKLETGGDHVSPTRERITILDKRLDEVVMRLYEITDKERIVIEQVLSAVASPPNFAEPVEGAPVRGPKKATEKKTGQKRAAS